MKVTLTNVTRTDRDDHHLIFKEQGNLILGMGFEPMRFATADLKPASLTNSDILVFVTLLRDCQLFGTTRDRTWVKRYLTSKVVLCEFKASCPDH